MGKLKDEIQKFKNEIRTRKEKIQKKIDNYNVAIEKLDEKIEIKNKLYVDYEINEDQAGIIKVEKELNKLIEQKEKIEGKIKLFKRVLNNKQDVSKTANKVFEAAVQEYTDKENNQRKAFKRIDELEEEIRKLELERDSLRNKHIPIGILPDYDIARQLTDVIEYIFDDINFKETPPIKRDNVYHEITKRIKSTVIKRNLLISK